MAFWGVEVKPGKPVTHSCDEGRRRLRISQATLGFGEASEKTVVQCNVGNGSPVLLFSLLPNKRESCRLDFEFEEADDVVFSVIGPLSVHLTGYYVQQNQQSNPHSDTLIRESYGLDIENTQTDGSNHHNDDDDVYEDSFINDDEVKLSSERPVLSSKGIHDATLQNAQPKDRNGCGKQLKKKDQVIESENDVNHDCEDEDGSLPVFKTTMSDDVEKIAQDTEERDDEAKDDDVRGSESKQKVDPLNVNDKQEGEKMPSLDVERTQINEENNELPDEMDNLVANIMMSIQGNNTKDTSINQNSPVSNGRDQLRYLDLEKPEKKRKECSVKKKKKLSKVQTDKEGHSVLGEDKEHGVKVSTNLEIDENHLVTPPELGSKYVQKSKKRRKELQLGETLTKGLTEQCQNTPEEDMFEQGLLHADSMAKDLRAETGEYEDQQRFEDASTEDIGAKSHSIPGEDEVMQEPHAEITAENGENQEQPTDSIISTKSESLANDNQHDKKIKKKLKKTQGKRGLNVGVNQMTDNQETTATKYEGRSTETVPLQKFTLSNGLVIEELVNGPTDGKIAATGKMVKLQYTAMLKESGHVFESVVGKASFKFRLGDENIIDGWNVGIAGMRVGDKRRLIIPPSMGFGDCGSEYVPPNSWLIYDIELLSVRR